jgi:hypothetical protein
MMLIYFSIVSLLISNLFIDNKIPGNVSNIFNLQSLKMCNVLEHIEVLPL